MKKNGFSLIELLAVIVILSFIVLITTPIVVNIISNTQKNSFKTSAHGILNAAELFYTKKLMGESVPRVEFIYNDDGETADPNVYGNLEYKGEKPKFGKVIVRNDGKIAFALYDGAYCAVKQFNSAEGESSENADEIQIITDIEDKDNCIAQIDE